jgi:hypothetical protein
MTIASIVNAEGGLSVRTKLNSLISLANDDINIKDFGAVGDGVADDTAALNAAIAVCNARLPHGSIYAPRGLYKISAPPTRLLHNTSIRGAGPSATYFVLTTAFTGDMFQWSEGWMGSDYNNFVTITFPQETGPSARNFSIVGNRGAAGQQNGLMFYDRNDLCLIENVDCFYLPGYALGIGFLRDSTQAYMRESRVTNFRAWQCGRIAGPIPAMEINGAGGAGNSNEIRFVGVDIYANYGPGLMIRSTASQVGGLQFLGLRIEGRENNDIGAVGDLLTVGDPVQSGTVNFISFYGLELIDPYGGYCAMKVEASSAANMPYGINVFGGSIGGGAMQANAKGLILNSGRNNQYRFFPISTTGTNLTVGPSPKMGGPNVIDASGAESTWTTSIDATSTNSVKKPSLVAFP